ncbi:hypothetical protein DFH09DRAFT_1084733 [Mycena vulgaris]|nr:hypothetical protein DFH09DRAFT_1084733 [Mycena vulgaris]
MIRSAACIRRVANEGTRRSGDYGDSVGVGVASFFPRHVKSGQGMVLETQGTSRVEEDEQMRRRTEDGQMQLRGDIQIGSLAIASDDRRSRVRFGFHGHPETTVTPGSSSSGGF